MRMRSRIVLIAALAAIPSLTCTPAVLAADLMVTPVKRAVVHHRTRVVADYDGTPIVLRRVRPTPVVGPYGTVALRGEYEAHFALGAIPRVYFNGRPVRN